jgi:hypothetical protein
MRDMSSTASPSPLKQCHTDDLNVDQPVIYTDNIALRNRDVKQPNVPIERQQIDSNDR